MAVLIFAETWDGKFKKSTYEAVSYGAQLASMLKTKAIALAINSSDKEKTLGNYGANKVVCIDAKFNPHAFATIIEKIIEEEEINEVVLSQTLNGKAVAPLLAVKLNASIITNIIALPSSVSPFIIKRKVFSNKAFQNVKCDNNKKVLTISPNSIGVTEFSQSPEVQKQESVATKSDYKTEVIQTDKSSGKISLTEAEIVISGGRGLKGPENWPMIEELAEILGGATACSKPVADVGWRPHGEHVGQTGIVISADLYIAIGISGAIQHLAGVSSSKIMVAINIDPEAPFFKAADYGIIGDAFEVVPKLNKALKEFKK